MANVCCQVVGGLNLSIDACVISINVNANTETFWLCNEVKLGPTIGSVSVSAYASDQLFKGCPSKAGVSINWIRKYNCEDNEVHFINSSQGQSYIAGEDGGLVRLNNSSGRSYPVINASSSSGPTSIYTQTDRVDGFGLSYSGKPWQFNTSSDESLIIENFGAGAGDMYLQNFDLTLNPGTFPLANYTFMFFIDD